MGKAVFFGVGPAAVQGQLNGCVLSGHGGGSGPAGFKVHIGDVCFHPVDNLLEQALHRRGGGQGKLVADDLDRQLRHNLASGGLTARIAGISDNVQRLLPIHQLEPLGKADAPLLILIVQRVPEGILPWAEPLRRLLKAFLVYDHIPVYGHPQGVGKGLHGQGTSPVSVGFPQGMGGGIAVRPYHHRLWGQGHHRNPAPDGVKSGQKIGVGNAVAVLDAHKQHSEAVGFLGGKGGNRAAGNRIGNLRRTLDRLRFSRKDISSAEYKKRRDRAENQQTDGK